MNRPGGRGPFLSSNNVQEVSDAVIEEMEAAKSHQSPSRRAWRRFRRNKLAMSGLFFLVFVVLLSTLGPLIAPDPLAVDLAAVLRPPGWEHWLGTDQAGRDVFARVVSGGRVSLTIGFASAISTVLVGLVLGTIAGYRGGAFDWFFMRLVEVVLSFPTLVLIIFFVTRFGRSVTSIVLVMALFQWPIAGRLVRNMSVAVKELEFVQAARAFGAKGFHVAVRHVLPSAVGPLTVAGTLLVAQAILIESALSFLGFGISPPTATWGTILNEAQSLTILETMPWLWIPAGLLITFTVLAINFVGDGLRDGLDPRASEMT